MLNRKIDNEIDAHFSNSKKALFLTGARQVGKTYSIRKYAKLHGLNLIEFNFLLQPEAMDIINGAGDVKELLLRISAYSRVPLMRSKTLIFFDEVQECPDVMTWVKALVDEGSYIYALSGSLLGVELKDIRSVPVGYMSEMQVYPMDFEEFLWALGEKSMMELIKMQFGKCKPLGADMHRKAMSLFRQYMIVGGMPKAVDTYVKTHDFVKVDAIKRAIINLYRNDIQKYAESEEAKVTSIFDQIPSQLQRHEKKFRLSEMKSGARMRDYENAFFWLNEAMVANICYGATEPSIGLNLKLENTSLKCYLADTGLLISMAFDENLIMRESLYKKLMMDKLEMNEGMLMENMVAQMLRAKGHKLFFYSNYSREAADRMELDFLIAKPTITSRHNISPIEVKSTSRYTIASLNKCILKYKEYLSTPYVIHTSDLEQKEGIVYLPLYMTPLL